MSTVNLTDFDYTDAEDPAAVKQLIEKVVTAANETIALAEAARAASGYQYALENLGELLNQLPDVVTLRGNPIEKSRYESIFTGPQNFDELWVPSHLSC